MKYDVFISYRRDGGDSFAMILKQELKERGLSVFHDIESLRSGDFNKQLYKEIEESDKMVLILPPNALDRCINDENDWVRLEVTHAFESGKDIIPIMLRGFVFPKNLPEPLCRISRYQGIEPRMDHTFQSSMDYLVSLIKGDAGYSPIDFSFDMRTIKTFASCGNEATVFKIRRSEDGTTADLNVNFEKTRLRDEIPEFAGAYFLKTPSVDVARKEKIVFEACSPDQSIVMIWVEIKPKEKKWMHESFEFELNSDFESYEIKLADFEKPETARWMEEITFVIKPVSFAREECLRGNLSVRNLKVV